MLPRPRTRRFRLILAGVDFSPQSANALRYAVALSQTCGGRVVALHAIDPLLTAAAVRAYAELPLIRETKQGLSRFVAKALGPDAARRVNCLALVGAARQALIAEGRRRHADVIVVGTNARSGVAKMFFGSTTEAMLRRYHGAVLVVPPRCSRPPKDWPHGTVVAAIGAGPHRRAMLSAAARTAEIFGGWLRVVTPTAPMLRSGRQDDRLVLLPLPDSARLRTFAQGGSAYEFVRRSHLPVLVLHTGRRIGHVELRHTAA
jgi:nucleotide-binding universal stress UspA family protein